MILMNLYLLDTIRLRVIPLHSGRPFSLCSYIRLSAYVLLILSRILNGQLPGTERNFNAIWQKKP